MDGTVLLLDSETIHTGKELFRECLKYYQAHIDTDCEFPEWLLTTVINMTNMIPIHPHTAICDTHEYGLMFSEGHAEQLLHAIQHDMATGADLTNGSAVEWMRQNQCRFPDIRGRVGTGRDYLSDAFESQFEFEEALDENMSPQDVLARFRNMFYDIQYYRT